MTCSTSLWSTHVSEPDFYLVLIRAEIRARTGAFLHRELIGLLVARTMKRLLFALLETSHCQVANVGSIQGAIRHEELTQPSVETG